MIETKQIKVKVRLEGVSVPFNSVTIVEAMDAPPMATITFPTNQNIIHILPKTIAQVFYQIGDTFYLIFQGELTKYGFSRGTDHKEVELSFYGFTQNWTTNYVIPMDVSIPLMGEKALYNIGFNFLDANGQPSSKKEVFAFASSIVTPLAKLAQLINWALLDLNDKGASAPPAQRKSIMEACLAKALDAYTLCGLYYRVISNAFGVTAGQLKPLGPDSTLTLKQILIYGSSTISSVIDGRATINFITNHLKDAQRAISIHDALKGLLEYFGYDFCEISVPAFSNGKLQRIFIKPKTHLLAPILCNAIFNDEIQDLQFSRDLDGEPTRLVNYATPFYLQEGGNDFAQVMLAVVVPQGIMLGAELDNLKSQDVYDPDTQQHIKAKFTDTLLKLSTEEKCRGIALQQYQDITGIEDAYVYSVLLKDNQKLPDIQTGNAFLANQNLAGQQAVSNNLLQQMSNPTDKEYIKIRDYHVHTSLINYTDARSAMRTASVITPYSPYRLCGFPGLIITDEFPPLVGVVQTIQSTLSADGSALQVVNFSHIRMAPPTTDDTTHAFFDEINMETVPSWYSDFSYTKVEDLYSKVVGKSKVTLYARYPTTSGMLAAIHKLQNDYDSSSDKYSFINQITSRPLITEDNLYTNFWLSGYGSDPKKLRTIKDPNFGDGTKIEYPFIKERRDRVNEIFKDLITV